MEEKLSLVERYEREKKKVKVLRCDACQKEFLLLGVKIDKFIIDDSKHGLHFVLSYIRCPHCGKVYPVCIDDNYSEMLQSNFDILNIRIVKARRKEKDVSLERLENLKKRQRKISVYRQNLMDKYSEAFTKLVEKELGNN